MAPVTADMGRHGLAILLLGAGLATLAAAADEKPNIVFMIADDLGFNDVSFRGSNQFQTPNIDALAYSGVILNRHYVLPTCTPSRTAIYTGLYPIRTGMQGYPLKAGEPRGLPLGLRTLPERLRGLGYSTNLVGKWHQGFYRSEFTPTRRGFDHHLGYWNGYMSYFSHHVHMDSANGLKEGRIGYDLHWDERTAWEYQGQYATHLFTKRAEDIIRDHNPAKGPLFLQIAHLAAHAGLNGSILEVPDEARNNRDYGYIQDENRRRLAGVIREMDESVGRVIRALDERGILNNTLIVFMADNGGETEGPHRNYASNWPLRGQKWTLYDGGVRGAAVVWSPKLRNLGSVSQNLVHATDWLPTFYEAAGGNLADLGKLDGKSQWPSLTRTASPARSEVLVNVDEGAALIQDYWKLVKGQQALGRSGYLGESGRNSSLPPYNTTAVVISPVAVALGKHTPPLTVETADDLRGQARSGLTARCRERGQPFDLKCTPYCLFKLDDDPCESTNLADVNPDIGKAMLARLAEWEKLVVPKLNMGVDDAADPRLHNMTWVPWRDPGVSTVTPVSPPATPPSSPSSPSSSTPAAPGAAAALAATLPLVLALLLAAARSPTLFL